LLIYCYNMINVFLLLGSNIGERESFLTKAIELIEQQVAPVVIKSAIYQTQAWGKTDEPDYLNQVIMLQTEKPAHDLLYAILDIEQQLGRKRLVKWGSRVIDIDILFYGDQVINEQRLTVPHPELHKRRFTLEPLAEIDPQFVHPVLELTIEELKNKLTDCLVVKKI
jgi:2-amino-4-hydroxy-6-hydroxymethyldihydropteridine diphosphokinase